MSKYIDLSEFTPEIGRNTFAMLRSCSRCGKKFDGAVGKWSTRILEASHNTHLWILCEECSKEVNDGN